MQSAIAGPTAEHRLEEARRELLRAYHEIALLQKLNEQLNHDKVNLKTALNLVYERLAKQQKK